MHISAGASTILRFKIGRVLALEEGGRNLVKSCSATLAVPYL